MTVHLKSGGGDETKADLKCLAKEAIPVALAELDAAGEPRWVALGANASQQRVARRVAWVRGLKIRPGLLESHIAHPRIGLFVKGEQTFRLSDSERLSSQQ